MDDYDGAYITLLQALFRQVSSKNNLIQLLNHRLLYQVVNRAEPGVEPGQEFAMNRD
jgi:hypothetical protein